MKKSLPAKIILGIIDAIVLFIVYWFALPPLNLRSTGFWSFLVFAVIFTSILYGGRAIIVGLKDIKGTSPKEFIHKKGGIFTWAKIVIGAIVFDILISIFAAVIGAQLFNATRYRDMISFEDGNFTEDVSELDMSAIPVVDRDTAARLGKRKLGEISDLVSQFEITENYTQINYKGSPYRVTTLSYGDVFKWLNNQAEGIPAYITVDMVTQEAALVRLTEGIKYSEGDYLMRNIHRYLRFNYPTKIFDELSFEIDDEGTPYWIAPCITYRVGLWSGVDIGGAVIVNAITGESNYYDLADIPSWVDQIFRADIVITQLNYHGLYIDGFFNSIFGQKGVLQTTDGYNYLAIDDDVWLYTGITSVTGDESNVGFVLVNMRTKETRFYSVPGAEEYSAMSSAQGQVQHLNYRSTFPILLNVSERPTYFVSLKDSAGLVKMYAFVDVERYQIVGTGTTVAEAKADYAKKLKAEDIDVPDVLTADITVSDVSFPVVDGNSKAYILADDGSIWIADISLDDRLVFLKKGSVISAEYSADGGSNLISKVLSIN